MDLTCFGHESSTNMHAVDPTVEINQYIVADKSMLLNMLSWALNIVEHHFVSASSVSGVIFVYMQLYLMTAADFHKAPEAVQALLNGPNQHSKEASLQFTAKQQFQWNYFWWLTIDWNGNCERRLQKKKDWRMTKDTLRVKGLWEVWVFGVTPLGISVSTAAVRKEAMLDGLLAFCLSVWLSICMCVCLLVHLAVCLSLSRCLSFSNLMHLSAAGETVN